MSERVHRELVVPAPPEAVWEVIVGSGWLAEEVEIELFPGGEATFVSGEEIRSGWVEEVEPPRRGEAEGARLVFWWTQADEPASRVELTLDPDVDGCTRVRLTESRPLELLDLVGIPLRGSGGTSYGPALLVTA